MPTAVFTHMTHVLGFGDADLRHLARLHEVVRADVPEVVDHLVAQIAAHPEAQPILAATEVQRCEMRARVAEWVTSALRGPYDDAYGQDRAALGRRHADLGLPQHFTLAVVNWLDRALTERVRATVPDEAAAMLDSLRKLLAIESAVMLDAYQQANMQRMRQLERDAFQAQLSEARHLAHIGQLAATLAHEIKNPLAGISGAVEVIRDSLGPDNVHWDVLGEALRQIGRVDRTVKDLLVYARPRPPRFQKCDLAALITRVTRFLQSEAGCSHVRFEHVGRTQLRIEADELQLEQLLMNLLLNAAQASAEGGQVQIRSVSGENHVRLDIEDNGCGMTPDVLRSAAEPFFTTKSRGTGLGLPICHKIVETHGGTMEVVSEPEKGTRVTITLSQPPSSG